jgi:hypothetical protein
MLDALRQRVVILRALGRTRGIESLERQIEELAEAKKEALAEE